MAKKPKKPKKTYTWRDGARFPVKPQVAGEELERISNENDGNLTPRSVVEESKPEEAPLHPCFEWDDERAAELHRDEQARNVIRSVHVTIEDSGNTEPQISYINVEVENVGSSYLPADRVMQDPDLRKQALNDALILLRGVQRRYQNLEELRDVFAAIDSVKAA